MSGGNSIAVFEAMRLFEDNKKRKKFAG